MHENILKLRPVAYRWKTDDAAAGLKFGFIAQEVEAIFPELVTTDPDTGHKSLAVGGLMPFVVNALQEQDARITALAGSISTQAGVRASALESLTLTGGLTVSGHVTFGEDTVGEAHVAAGTRETQVAFKKPYAYRPVVTVTPQSALDDPYWVSDVTPTGFTIRVRESVADTVTFSWHAFTRSGLGLSVPPLPPVIPMEVLEPPVSAPAEPEPEPVAPVADEAPVEVPAADTEPKTGDVPTVPEEVQGD